MTTRVKILVIDDDDDFRASLREILESERYEVIEADSGKAGLQKLLEHRPDVIVLDIMMESLEEGYGVNQAIKYQEAYEDFRGIPVLMVSSIMETPYERFPRAEEVGVAQSERLASLGMLAAGVAHEINNPLGGVLSLTALTLEDLDPDDPKRENLEEVVRQSERCREIVKGLLEFSRQSEVGSERVDVTDVLDEIVSLIRRQAMFFNIELVKAYASELPEVIGDRSQLQQVFMNMLMNSVQAMDEKGTLTLITRVAPDRYVEVLISDTGRGIPPEDIDRIFDPFYSTKPAGEGTGLGLSIAYGIVTKHRGTIQVESEVGRGTTFTIRLPGAPKFAATSRKSS